MANKYLENRMQMEEGFIDKDGKSGKKFEEKDWIVKSYNNCKTKLRHNISKIVIEGNSNDIIAKEILEWSKESKPVVIQKEP